MPKIIKTTGWPKSLVDKKDIAHNRELPLNDKPDIKLLVIYALIIQYIYYKIIYYF